MFYADDNKSSEVIWEEHVAVAQLCNKVLIGYNGPIMGHPKFTPENYPSPLMITAPFLIHPSLNRPHSPPQMASGAIQLFCHSTLSGHTDRQTCTHTERPTDGISDRSIPIAFTLY